jgi:hypothetical protein
LCAGNYPEFHVYFFEFEINVASTASFGWCFLEGEHWGPNWLTYTMILDAHQGSILCYFDLSAAVSLLKCLDAMVRLLV